MPLYEALELDFLPVGSESKCGDAIALRYGTPAEYNVMVVDGGDLAAGAALVEHINSRFGVVSWIEHVVCTHCDSDHVSGLRNVIEKFEIHNLWVHQPWLHAAELNPHFKGNWTDDNLAAHLRYDCFPIVSELCDLAEQKGVTLREPFAGVTIGPFTVLAPHYDTLMQLIPRMDQTPSSKAASAIDAAIRSLKQRVLSVFETFHHETLQDPGFDGTSVANQTSVVLFSETAGGILLTGDTGTRGLHEAAYIAAQLGITLSRPKLVQIPHHGSRHNVSPAALNEVIGLPTFSRPDPPERFAYTSAAAKSEMPRKVVENAFARRGYECYVTKGGIRTFRHNFPMRPDFTYGLPGSPFHDFVED